jgi:hypothetical protein
MNTKDMSPGEQLSVQVTRLLSLASEHGDLHLAEVERDLVQMDGLLAEAIKKLCASFMEIHRVADLQQEALNSLLADGQSAPVHAARFEALREEINQHIGAAVTGLQFQDMTSQLIGRMAVHLAGMRDVFGALDVNGAVPPESGTEALLAVLGSVSDRVAARFSELEGVSRSTVNQRHMESGDIDLF